MELFYKEALPPQPEPLSPKLIDGNHIAWFASDGDICIVDIRTGATIKSAPSDIYSHVMARIHGIVPPLHNKAKIHEGQKKGFNLDYTHDEYRPVVVAILEIIKELGLDAKTASFVMEQSKVALMANSRL